MKAATERAIRNFFYWPMFWRWPRRWRCHKSFKPCQHTDHPMCN